MTLTVIILTYNEQLHLERCVRSVQRLSSKIFVVDSFSLDGTVDVARSLGVEVIERKFINNADQFQWALDNLKINTQWVMRIDADEYLELDLQEEIQETFLNLPEATVGVYIKRKVFFQGQWIRYGGFYPQTLLRIWKVGHGRVEQRWMDEHIVLPPNSKTITLKGHLVDENLKGITFWTDKHNRYASREMTDILIQKYFPEYKDRALRKMNVDGQARWKRILKDDIYINLPAGIRVVLYFFYRYFLKLGFLDGSKGFIWHFLQGFWYRLLVDVKVMEVEAQAGGDPQKVISILRDQYGVEI